MKRGSHRNSGILSGKLAATKSHTRQQCPSLWPPRQHPCPYAGPCPCPAQPGFKRPWAQEPVNPDTGCAPRSPVPLCLCFSGSNHPTPNRAPAACCPANFSALFLQVHKTVLPADRLSKSLTQILARPVVPRQIPAARRPLDPDPLGPRSPRGCRPAGRVRPGPSRPGGHSPICARLSCTRHSPHAARHQNVSMASERPAERAEWSRRGRALGGGRGARGKQGARTCRRLGSGWQ